MTLVRFDPFRELTAIQDRVNRIFGEAGVRNGPDDLFARGEWVPAVDIFDDDDRGIVIRAELPGLTRDEVHVRIENNTLTLSGERKREETVKNDRYHRLERSYGTFSRSFALPPMAAADKVTAEFRNGVLEVLVPMREEARPRQIDVKVSG